MQNFVKVRGQAGSPQNGQPAPTSDRRTMGANAKVALKDRPMAQQPHPQSAIPSRGFGIAQNSSAIMQQYPQPRQPGPGQGLKRDSYDTDVESLDTTVDQSVIQVEDSQHSDHLHERNGQVADSGEGEDGDEADSGEEDGEEEFDDFEFTQDDILVLEANDLREQPREYQIAFLQQARPHTFRTVDGDSYPTTTNGEPSERDEEQEPPSEGDRGPVSPSPQRPTATRHLTRPLAPQHELVANLLMANQHAHNTISLFQQSANLRGQQRSTAQPVQHAIHAFQHNISALPSSQPPTYSQANHEPARVQPVHSNTRQATHPQATRTSQHAQRQTSGSARVQFLAPKPIEPPAPSKRPLSARAKVEPVLQQELIEQAPTEDLDVARRGDYDHETLSVMSYDKLKTESFDTDPRADPPVLTDDILQKPLAERLEFVQKNLDASQQAKVLCALPTSEWEDAGDWFLDQFQKIIQRTKEARQKKRKLAQEFEYEVEKRHKHVSKKQHQVEEAMNKMKMQGEGLVPRSPRPTRSLKPKRG